MDHELTSQRKELVTDEDGRVVLRLIEGILPPLPQKLLHGPEPFSISVQRDAPGVVLVNKPSLAAIRKSCCFEVDLISAIHRGA